MAESMCLLCMLYIIISGVYFGYNIKMGSWWTGMITAALWPVTAILWVVGSVLVLKDERL